MTLLGPMFAAVGPARSSGSRSFASGDGAVLRAVHDGRDYPMIMAVVLLYGAFLAIMNLAVDLLYGVIRPPHPILACRLPSGRRGRWR